MWSLLRSGVEVLKHGRSGKPKFKTLLCDLHMTKLYWRGPGAKPDPDLDDSDAETGDDPTALHPQHAYHSKQGRRSSYVKTNADRVILIREIAEVRPAVSALLALTHHSLLSAAASAGARRLQHRSDAALAGQTVRLGQHLPDLHRAGEPHAGL